MKFSPEANTISPKNYHSGEMVAVRFKNGGMLAQLLTNTPIEGKLLVEVDAPKRYDGLRAFKVNIRKVSKLR
jgi:hypothetical protein